MINTLISYLLIGFVVAEATRYVWIANNPRKHWYWSAWQIIAFLWIILLPLAFILVFRDAHAEKIQAAKNHPDPKEGRVAHREESRHKETDE